MNSQNQDGGWGWIVVAAAFVAQMLSDGISYGFGILYVDLMDTFHGTSAEISSIGALSYGSFCFIGPVAGMLTNRFGYRLVTVLGAFLEAAGILLSAYTPNLNFLYFSVGILMGVGSGMIYIACFVCVSAYFLSKRPLATSIASCGSSVGTFFFGFLYRVCIDHYGWRGALLVFSGLMLNGVVCGVLFRPFVDKFLTDLDLTVVVEDDGRNHECENICERLTSEAENTGRPNSTSICQKTSSQSYSTAASHANKNVETHGRNSIDKIVKNEQCGTKTEKAVEVVCFNEKTTSATAENQRLLADHDENKMQSDYGLMSSKLHPDGSCITCKEGMTNEHLTSDNSFDMELDTNHDNCTNPGNKPREMQQSVTAKVVNALLGTTNLHLFQDWKFILFGLSTFLYCFGYGTPFVLLPDMAETNGFSASEAAWVISECGISAIAGKFIFGVLSQALTRRDIHANTKLNSYSVILSGFAIACAPWAISYPVLLVIGGAFGLLSAAVNTVVTLVLIELFGEDRLADAFGWLNFFGGVGYITGPVVAGWLYDVTKAYMATFLAAGSSLILSGFVLFPIFITDSCKASK